MFIYRKFTEITNIQCVFLFFFNLWCTFVLCKMCWHKKKCITFDTDILVWFHWMSFEVLFQSAFKFEFLSTCFTNVLALLRFVDNYFEFVVVLQLLVILGMLGMPVWFEWLNLLTMCINRFQEFSFETTCIFQIRLTLDANAFCNRNGNFLENRFTSLKFNCFSISWSQSFFYKIKIGLNTNYLVTVNLFLHLSCGIRWACLQ